MQTKCILCYDNFYVIIHDGEQSRVVQSGKVRKKKGLFKVNQRKSGNVREFEQKSERLICKGQGNIHVKW